MPEDPKSAPEFTIVTAVNIKAPDWTEAVPDIEALAGKVVDKVLANPTSWRHYKSGPPEAVIEISICFADKKTVEGLNEKFRDKKSATNVLSFPGTDGGHVPDGQEVILGDIILAFGVVAGEAKAQTKSFTDHTVHLLVHGVLHLLGYTHDEDAAAEEMETLETQTLASFDISDPYTINEAERT